MARPAKQTGRFNALLASSRFLSKAAAGEARRPLARLRGASAVGREQGHPAGRGRCGPLCRLVLVDANLDPITPVPGAGGSSGIAAYGEEEFLAGGWEEVRDRVGPGWWSTMRLTGREALHRTAVHLVRGPFPPCGSCWWS